MRYTLFVLAVSTLLGLSGIASADIVQTTFTYDFGNGDRNGSAASSGSAPYFDVTDYVAASPQETTGDSSPEDSGLISGGSYVRTHIMPAYQTFSLNQVLPTGTIQSLDSITFDLTTFGFTTPFTIGSWVQVDVLASTDGFGSSTNLGNLLITQTTTADPSGSANLDLTGFTEFNGQSNVDFRVQFSSNVVDNGNYGLMDNFALTITAIPEPGSMAIFGLVACVGLVRRRK